MARAPMMLYSCPSPTRDSRLPSGNIRRPPQPSMELGLNQRPILPQLPGASNASPIRLYIPVSSSRPIGTVALASQAVRSSVSSLPTSLLAWFRHWLWEYSPSSRSQRNGCTCRSPPNTSSSRKPGRPAVPAPRK